MKRILSAIMAIFILLSAASCGKDDVEKSEGNSVKDEVAETEPDFVTTESESESEESSAEETTAIPESESEIATDAETEIQTTVGGETDRGETAAAETQNQNVFHSDRIEVSIVENKDAETTVQSSAQTTVQPDPETAPVQNGYEGISRREYSSYKKVYFSQMGKINALSFNIPNDWNVSGDQDNGYIFTLNGEAVGHARSASRELSHNLCQSCSTVRRLNITINECILKNGNEYDLRYHLTSNDCSLELNIDYDMLSETSATNLKTSAKLEAIHSDGKFGAAPVSNTNGSKTILIAGNSFIGTSDIAFYLADMCRNAYNEYGVYGRSVGYASVSTYIADEAFVDEVCSGQYAVLVMCGLYSYDDANNIATLWNYCQQSGTQLVILPAHNENRNVINYAQSNYPGLCIIDWKSEIDMFIDRGKSKWDFCYDDEHLHSTSLAGYVGAHMLFRALFGANPPDISSLTSGGITQSEADMHLGEYTKTGVVDYITDIVYYVN